MFPVKVSRTLRIQAAGISNHCLGFLSANRRCVPATLTNGLCLLVAAITAFQPETLDSVAENAFGLRILAKVTERSNALPAACQQLVDGLFEKRRWKDASGADADSLTAVAATLTGSSHDEIWLLITRRMSFLENAAAGDPNLGRRRQLLTNVRGTPMGTFTYDMLQRGDAMTSRDDFDWSDPRQLLMVSVACTTAAGRRWLGLTDAFGSLGGFVATCSRRTEVSLDPDGDRKSVDSIVRVAYSCCASIEGQPNYYYYRYISGSSFQGNYLPYGNKKKIIYNLELLFLLNSICNYEYNNISKDHFIRLYGLFIWFSKILFGIFV